MTEPGDTDKFHTMSAQLRTSTINLKNLTLSEQKSELENFLKEIGEPTYRVNQILQWIYKKKVSSFSEMSNISLALREELDERYNLNLVKQDHKLVSTDGTRKFLWKLSDGEAIESVLIPTRSRNTMCISTQVGCPLKCSFCATGFQGFKRNLTQGEIIDQAISMMREIESDTKTTNIVFMGMGEPLLNYDNLLNAIRVINSNEGMEIGARKITISTAGLSKKIIQLANENIQIKLAVSLTAPNDELRNELMPINLRFPLKELIHACKIFHSKSNKLITFEYVILPGVNDGKNNAEKLLNLLKDIPAKINLISYNPHPDSAYRAPTDEELEKFFNLTSSHDHPVSIRQSRGIDVLAACGQLKSKRSS